MPYRSSCNWRDLKMRLSIFRVQNYRSIQDTEEITLSDIDNVSVFAGQNESGKSSLLMALRDFQAGKFDPDSQPFTTGENLTQLVSCRYSVEDNDDVSTRLNAVIKTILNLRENEIVFDEHHINSIRAFTITKESKNKVATTTKIDDVTFNIFKSAILNRGLLVETIEPLEQGDDTNEPESIDVDITQNQNSDESQTSEPSEGNEPEKYIEISDSDNEKVAGWFMQIVPRIVFFDDLPDVLPDKILIGDLENYNSDAKGYQAARNLEKILDTDFVEKNQEIDAVRMTRVTQENETLSIDFQKDWGQRIYGENNVEIKFDFQKREGETEAGSYINFYVETKLGQPLAPRMRSRGLIWFLSLWLELRAQDLEHRDLILLLDEPDQHLHVRAQKDILKLINKLARGDEGENGAQVLYATHSPYLVEIKYLTRINLVLNNEKEGTIVEEITTSKIDTENKRDALQPISDAMGLHVSEFSVINKKNVILEGISDFYYFSAMKKLLKEEDDYRFLPGIGVRQIKNLISLCIGYGLVWLAIIDDDPLKGGKDSKNKFEEIRDYVFDGDQEKTKEKVLKLNKIVGIENMFEIDDLKLIDPTLRNYQDKVKAVGKKRKVLFAIQFHEKVIGGEITVRKLSKESKDRFKEAFAFIKKNL